MQPHKKNVARELERFKAYVLCYSTLRGQGNEKKQVKRLRSSKIEMGSGGGNQMSRKKIEQKVLRKMSDQINQMLVD